MLALQRGRITCAIFLRWFPRAMPDLVVSSPAVSELYWGEKALHVRPKIANLGPRLGRSTQSEGGGRRVVVCVLARSSYVYKLFECIRCYRIVLG